MNEDTLDLDIVVIALLGGTALKNCLDRLQSLLMSCCVVLRSDLQTSEHWRTLFPDMKFIDGGDQPVPIRRVLGLQATHRERVAFIEDTTLPLTSWLQAANTALDDPAVAMAGGPVSISPRLDARSMAMACGEYGRYAPSRIREFSIATSAVPGNNMVLRRSLVQPLLRERNGLIEGELFAALLTRGHKLAMHPSMQVEYVASDPNNNRLRARFQHGRLYASGRVTDSGISTRLAWFLKSLLLPLLLAARSLSSLPGLTSPLRWPLVGMWVIVLETAWAAGECTGYLAGRGKSLQGWR